MRLFFLFLMMFPLFAIADSTKRQPPPPARDAPAKHEDDARDKADRADCIRARNHCNSSFCAKAMDRPPLGPCPNDPKCGCEDACSRASTSRCAALGVR